MLRPLTRLTLALDAALLAPSGPTLRAQGTVLGTFRWQLQPFCNVVTVNLIQQGTVFTMDGVDDQCGAAQRAPIVGLATPNPDGSITVGLTIVTAPGGRAVQVAARLSLPSVNGTWSDSAGNGGVFAFNASSGGSPRPSPSLPGSAIAPGTITSTQLAAAIFAGSGGATTVARSDHLHDDRYYTKAQDDAAAPVVIEGPGVFTPMTLTVQYDHAVIAETVVTPTAGHLLISKFIRRAFTCAAGGAFFFVTIDGVPVRSTAAYVSPPQADFAGFLSGATVGVIAAGSHTISVASQCVSGPYTQSGGVSLTHSSIVVLP
jgi:hypothetical protein